MTSHQAASPAATGIGSAVRLSFETVAIICQSIIVNHDQAGRRSGAGPCGCIHGRHQIGGDYHCFDTTCRQDAGGALRAGPVGSTGTYEAPVRKIP